MTRRRILGMAVVFVLACLTGPATYYGLVAAFGPPPPDPWNKACEDAGYRVVQIWRKRLCLTPEGLVAMVR